MYKKRCKPILWNILSGSKRSYLVRNNLLVPRIFNLTRSSVGTCLVSNWAWNIFRVCIRNSVSFHEKKTFWNFHEILMLKFFGENKLFREENTTFRVFPPQHFVKFGHETKFRSQNLNLRWAYYCLPFEKAFRQTFMHMTARPSCNE